MKLVPLALCLLIFPGTAALAGDWPWWRGPNHDGIAEPGQEAPVAFSASENCRWSADLPGRSHGSAAVAGDRVFLAVAEEEAQIQSVMCFDRDTGGLKWKTEIHRGGLVQKTNKKASWASGTPACDGERVFVNFINGDAVFTTALDLDGKQLWRTRITGYTIHQGYGSSPAIHGDLVLVSADNKSGGAVCGLNRKTGEVVWKRERAQMPNYASPVVFKVGGRDQLFLTGTEKVSSFDPLTGETLWEVDGATTECVTTAVTDGERIFTSGGYPKNHVAAMVADGSGTVAWETKDRVYVPSMLVRDGRLYAVMDAGIAVCWNSATGEERWKARLGGNFSASPVMLDDRIYAADEAGTVHVFRVKAEGIEVLAENKVGDQIFATPVICDGRIFLRAAFFDGDKRSEKLFCFAKGD